MMRRKVIQHPSQEEAIAVRTTEQPPELGKQQAQSQSWPAEEAEGESGKGPRTERQKAVTCTHVLLCHHSLGSAGR